MSAKDPTDAIIAVLRSLLHHLHEFCYLEFLEEICLKPSRTGTPRLHRLRLNDALRDAHMNEIVDCLSAANDIEVSKYLPVALRADIGATLTALQITLDVQFLLKDRSEFRHRFATAVIDLGVIVARLNQYADSPGSLVVEGQSARSFALRSDDGERNIILVLREEGRLSKEALVAKTGLNEGAVKSRTGPDSRLRRFKVIDASRLGFGLTDYGIAVSDALPEITPK